MFDAELYTTSISGPESCADGFFKLRASPQMCIGPNHTTHFTGRASGELHYSTLTFCSFACSKCDI